MWGGAPQVVGSAVYPGKAASTRLRLGPLASSLEQRGISFSTWTYLDDESLDRWVSGQRLGSAARGLGRVPSLFGRISAGSALVVQRECLPWNSLLPEEFAKRRVPVIWDIDDAMWLSSPGMRGRVRGGASKYAKMARIATEVWAGSETVASWCQDQGARTVRLVPTVTAIPSAIAVPAVPRRLVWVGTPATVRYLHRILETNEQAFGDWIIEVVGAEMLPYPNLRIESFPWTQANEDRALSRAWAGLYPIDTTHEFSAGKSALKAVLMGAHGIPVIATDTASNAAVIEDGVTGLLVRDGLGWADALMVLSDPAVRSRLGLAARTRIAKDYNPETWGSTLASAIAEYL